MYVLVWALLHSPPPQTTLKCARTVQRDHSCVPSHILPLVYFTVVHFSVVHLLFALLYQTHVHQNSGYMLIFYAQVSIYPIGWIPVEFRVSQIRGVDCNIWEKLHKVVLREVVRLEKNGTERAICILRRRRNKPTLIKAFVQQRSGRYPNHIQFVSAYGGGLIQI